MPECWLGGASTLVLTSTLATALALALALTLSPSPSPPPSLTLAQSQPRNQVGLLPNPSPALALRSELPPLSRCAFITSTLATAFDLVPTFTHPSPNPNASQVGASSPTPSKLGLAPPPQPCAVSSLSSEPLCRPAHLLAEHGFDEVLDEACLRAGLLLVVREEARVRVALAQRPARHGARRHHQP